MPLYSIIFIGGFGICLLGFTFILFLWNRMQASQAGIDATGKMNPLLVASEVRNDVENIEWLTELLLKQEFGKLKIGQIELLDEIRRFSDHALKQVSMLQKKEQTGRNVSRILSPIPHAHRHHETPSASADALKNEGKH